MQSARHAWGFTKNISREMTITVRRALPCYCNVFIPDVLHIDDNVYRSPMLPLYLQSPSMLGMTQLGACCAVTTAASHSTSVSRGTSLLALAMPGRRGRDCSIPEAVQISQASQLLAG